MGNRLTGRKDKIRGFGVPDARALDSENLRANDSGVSNSSYTQAGPRPGSAEPASALTRLFPEISAAQDIDLTLRVVGAGLPTRTSGGLVYRIDGELNDNQYRGWSPHNWPNGWSDVVYDAATTVINGFDAVTIPSTQEVVCVFFGTGASTARVWDPIAKVWNTTGGLGVGASTSQVALVVLPGEDERILALYEENGEIDVEFSDDNGFTWAPYASRVADQGAGAVRIRAAYSGTNILMLVDLGTNNPEQWASSDLGTTFTKVSTLTGFGDELQVLPLDGGGFIVTHRDSATTNEPRSARIGSAFEDLANATVVNIDSTQTLRRLVSIRDPQGMIYAFGWGLGASSDESHMWRSDDDGLTWGQFLYGPLDMKSATRFLNDVAIATSNGEAILVANWAGVGARTGSLFSHTLGGWGNIESRNMLSPTTIGERKRPGFGASATAGADASCWFGIDLPDNFGGWTATLTGGATAAILSPGWLRLTCVGAETANYNNTFTNSGSYLILYESRVVSGGSQATTDVGCEFRMADGVFDFRGDIRTDTLGITVRDIFGAADLATAAFDTTTAFQLAINVIDTGYVSVWWRRPTDPTWTPIGINQQLTDGGPSLVDDNIEWGNTGGGANVSEWRFFQMAENHEIANGLVDLSGIPNRIIFGKKVTPDPYPIAGVGTLARAAHISARQGPGRIAETWDADRSFEHPITNIFAPNSPSPADTWQTTTTAAAAIIALNIGDDTLAGGTQLGRTWSLVLGLFNVNFQKAHLESETAVPGVWTTHGTYDGGVGFTGLTMARDGDTLRVNTAATADAGRYLAKNEFAGGHVLMTGNVARTIVSHGAGAITQNATLHPEFLLDGVAGADPAAAAMTFVAPNGVLVIHFTEAQFFRRRWRLRIPIQDCPDTGFKIGAMHIGYIQGAGQQWSNGYSVGMRGNVSSRRTAYGTNYRKQRGPPARTAIISYADGTTEKPLRGAAGLDVDYLGSSVGAPNTAHQDVWRLLQGVFEETKAGELPIILLMKIPDASDVTINDRSLFLYGQFSERTSMQWSNILGDEGVDEYGRGETIEVEELI